MKKKLLQFLIFLIYLCRLVSTDMHAAIVELEELVKLETALGKQLENYLILERNRLERIKSFVENVRNSRKAMEKPVENIITKENPDSSSKNLNMKQIFAKLIEIEQLLRQDLAKDLKREIEFNRFRFPNSSDELRGAVAALFRLQDTYNISTRDMANGIFPGLNQTSQLSAEDCFELSTIAFKNQRYGTALEWMSEALHFHEVGRHDDSLTKKALLEHLAWIEYIRSQQKGNTERALNLTFEILQLDPNHNRALENVMFYKKLIESKAEGARETHEQVKAMEEERVTRTFKEGEYATMCRGEIPELPRKVQTMLKCWYHGKFSPYLVMRPIKVELAYYDPNIYIFRDFISDKEIKEVINIAKPMLKRATVFNPQSGVLEYADYRTSKSAWLNSSKYPLIKRIDTRIEAVTGLTASTAEDLQVQNYGLAGQYEYHYDFGEPGSPLEQGKNGNRIATVLIYFNDARAGGATVFTKLKINIKPTKGDAIMWWNLKRSGDGDYRTEHAGCPVISGVKWVANKWFHLHGQEFLRPCSLDPKL